MTVQITIVGLGQIGGSFGLALAGQKDMFERTGHDRDPDVARQALKVGAVDKISANLPSAVSKADVVLLALPTDQIRETMQVISQDLKQDSVVLDTSPIKETISLWAKELLPGHSHYVGLTPVINPNYLLMTDSGITAAREDLFQRGMLCIVTPPSAASDVIKLAADLTRMVGASALFVDPVENDSLMAATHILPQLLSAALLNATVDQPGWYEARKVAGRAYAEVTNPIVQLSEPKALSSSALYNRANVLRVIDGMVASLQALRSDIESEDGQALEARLERARQGRMVWWSQRQAATWNEDASKPQEISTGSQIFGRLLGMGRDKKK